VEYLTSIKQLIKNNFVIVDKGYYFFEEAWDFYSKHSSYKKEIKDMLHNPNILIPFNSHESFGGYPKYLKIDDKVIELFKSQLIIMMALIDLQTKIKAENINTDLIQTTFPLLNTTRYRNIKENDLIDLKKLHITTYICKMKNKINNAVIPYLIGVYNNLVLFLQPGNEIKEITITNNYVGTAFVKFKYYIADLELCLNNKEKNNLVVVMRNQVS